MSQKTKIQYADSTINPTMGCPGCELFPPPSEVFRKINAAVIACALALHDRAPSKEIAGDHKKSDAPCGGNGIRSNH